MKHGDKNMCECNKCNDKNKSMEYCNNCLAENNPELWIILTKQFALTI